MGQLVLDIEHLLPGQAIRGGYRILDAKEEVVTNAKNETSLLHFSLCFLTQQPS
eukprot:CAMPEP_0181339036 /NCGR_PEP_ID=MMETSP1101-20121128/28997_1 /TAXON_ID=46948 /ORGANISM="Rhodomonas abbreviata, Strain Caron Lab Isolate" /LENGTH=53 /DNA_ID=CAMNT_0023449889 /DNA_START=1 /DNA_END=159 /DNA_ORIENTATION=+